MKPSRLLLILSLTIAAIASAACSDSDNPCANLDCATGLSSINLTVIDGATGAAIDQPTFLVNGTPMQATCLPAEDASATCARWSLLFGYGGTYTIDVHAMGYVNTSVTVQLAGPNPEQCCGSGSSTDATVTMQTQ